MSKRKLVAAYTIILVATVLGSPLWGAILRWARTQIETNKED